MKPNNDHLSKRSFTDFFIQRPVIALIVCFMLVLFGIVSISRLPVRQFPKIDSSVITITTQYPGASAQTIASTITRPLENAIANVQGIDYIEAQSNYNQSVITVHLKIGYNINYAMSDINAQVSSTLWELPQNINDPIIQKNDPNATPVYYFAFSSDTVPAIAIGNFLTTTLKPLLSTVPGVGQVTVFGENKYAMRIWLDPNLMTAQNITASDVQNALNSGNVQAAAGKIETQYQQYQVQANTDLHTAKQFNDLIVKQSDGKLVRIKDIGHAELGAQDSDSYSVFLDGKPAVAIAIIPKSDANPLVVAKGIQKILPQMKQMLPQGVKLSLSYNVSSFISASLKEVVKTLIEAMIIVMLVVFMILGSLRTVVVPLVTIPLSLISACTLMFLLGYSINTLTLLAAVLAIGLVVDDAIVVTENIHRHIINGDTPFQAAIKGTREIRFAVIAMTLTLASAYLPIAFITGLTGILFSEFALALACTVIMSGIFALVLSPMMCSKLMKSGGSGSKFEHFVDNISQKTSNAYQKVLHFLIKIRWLVLGIALIIYAGGIIAFTGLHSELAPPEDQGYLMGIMRGPALANLNYIEKHSQEIADIYRQSPDVYQDMVINGFPFGVNSAFTLAVLKPWNERKDSAFKLLINWFPKMYELPGVMAYPVNPPTLPGSTPFVTLEYVLKTTQGTAYLNQYTQKFLNAVQQWGGVLSLDTDFKLDKPYVDIQINRNLAAELGVSMQQIAQTLSTYLGQPISTRFVMDNQNYEVIPQLYAKYRNKPNIPNNLYVRSASGKLIPLANLVTIKQVTAARQINDFQQLNSAKITGVLPSSVTIGTAYDKLNQIAKQILPNDIHTDTAGQLRQYVEAKGKMTMVFIFAILFIYLVLAAQFENFVDPLIVMLSVPLSLTGALITLRVLGITLNIYTEIGLVTLLGLMSKQAILIVEFANQLQQRGYEFTQAIIEASGKRLRPIIMTSLAMVLGAIPLLKVSGAGAISRLVMGLVIVSGLGIGTILTVFIIPVMYHILSRKKPAH
ncbi:MAG: efflux RND transporter permease subunit [Pseudomonadota bacterium]